MVSMTTILLLTISNIFMTFAWYGHLKYKHASLFEVIAVSWLIAFFEYCFQVPSTALAPTSSRLLSSRPSRKQSRLPYFQFFPCCI